MKTLFKLNLLAYKRSMTLYLTLGLTAIFAILTFLLNYFLGDKFPVFGKNQVEGYFMSLISLALPLLVLSSVLVSNFCFGFVKREGLTYVMQSKPISRKKMFFSNFLNSSIFTSFFNIVYYLLTIFFALIFAALKSDSFVTDLKLFLLFTLAYSLLCLLVNLFFISLFGLVSSVLNANASVGLIFSSYYIFTFLTSLLSLTNIFNNLGFNEPIKNNATSLKDDNNKKFTDLAVGKPKISIGGRLYQDQPTQPILANISYLFDVSKMFTSSYSKVFNINNSGTPGVAIPQNNNFVYSKPLTADEINKEFLTYWSLNNNQKIITTNNNLFDTLQKVKEFLQYTRKYKVYLPDANETTSHYQSIEFGIELVEISKEKNNFDLNSIVELDEKQKSELKVLIDELLKNKDLSPEKYPNNLAQRIQKFNDNYFTAISNNLKKFLDKTIILEFENWDQQIDNLFVELKKTESVSNENEVQSREFLKKELKENYANYLYRKIPFINFQTLNKTVIYALVLDKYLNEYKEVPATIFSLLDKVNENPSIYEMNSIIISKQESWSYPIYLVFLIISIISVSSIIGGYYITKKKEIR
ncbi:ABC transporter permease [Mycoplasmopsis alligatoris]|uniref:Uncharacterized protein n=1 Tax=Mycoplasmopsis alligatoris A21JP2 TaxID=747682 RepID=D4XWB6_9BACT|nr:ABC transporter permease [Mycoplasmopsis alligatoris]EFF41121.1 hypothetical protein MALL_0515 [Mycoplasmopsis alligatoris A21JP2]